MSAAAVVVGRQLRALSFAVVLAVTLGAAVVTWAQVVDRLRNAEPIEVTGSASAIVWSGRVFKSEAELAKFLRGRGIDYERWVKTHPAAVAILRSRGGPAATGAAAPAKSAAAAPAEPKAPSGTEAAAAGRAVASSAGSAAERVTLGALAIPAVMTLGLLLAIGAALPTRIAERAAGTNFGRVLELADRNRIYLVGAALSIGVGGLLGVAL